MTPDPEQTKNEISPDPLSALTLQGMEALVGQTLNGRYAIEKEIARGGMGIVYLARDQQLHRRQVVVKLLLDKAFLNDYVVKKFHQEIEALSRLNHPGIVGIVEAGELAGNRPFIVMQYVDGVTLRSQIRPGGLNLRRVANLMQQVGRALTASHERGILHRDLKPENIMLQDLGSGEELAKLIDFGVARVKDSLIAPTTDLPVSPGTISYMAPEQLNGQELTAASDIYAMGIIAYEMLTGHRPFNPVTAFQLLQLQQAGLQVKPAELRPNLSAGAEEVIVRSLSFDPEDRPDSARSFGDALARALLDEVEIPRPRNDEAELLPSTFRTAETLLVSTDGQPEAIPTPARADSPVEAQSRDKTLETHKGRVGILLGILALILACATTVGIWYAWPWLTGNKPAVSTPFAGRVLTYKLSVQKMRNGHPEGPPFDASDQETFEDGSKFRLDVRSPQSGYLYLLNEGPAADGRVTYSLLFPEPKTNAGSPYLSANQNIQTGWMVFVKQAGTEKFWMIWSATAVAELEAVKGVMNDKDRGEISNEIQVRSLHDFLNKYAAAKPEIDKQETRETTVKVRGDVLANVITLDHR